MKKIIRLTLILLTGLLVLSGCTDKTRNKQYDLGGKTYYNTVDEFGNEDHSRVWFGKDGSFVLRENYASGSYEASGNWNVKENVVTLEVAKSQLEGYSTIIFEIQDEETLKLKTGLQGSKTDAIYSTKEVKGSSVTPGTDELETLIYINASQDWKNRSKLILNSDFTFTMQEQNDFSIMEVTGTFEQNGATVIMKDLVPKGALGGKETIRFTIYDGDTLILQDDLGLSMEHDVFTKNGEIPAELVVKTKLFKHRKNEMVEVDDFLPTVEFYDDGTFILTENVFAGMAKFKGTYKETADAFICTVTDASQLQGFNCDDVPCNLLSEIRFVKENDTTLLLKTHLCLSRIDDVFDLVP